MTHLIYTIRIVVHFPFVVFGVALFALAELISGHTLVYNARNMVCSKCGHKSEGIIELIRHQPKK